MPRDYSKGKVYCLRNRAENDKMVYVGSTVRNLSERMSEHRRGIKEYPTFKLYELMGRVGVEHFHIELLADFPCERKEQLLAEEGRLIRLHNMVEEGTNVKWTGRSRAETVKACADAYRSTHKEELKEKERTYREAHREERNLKANEYYQQTKVERKAYRETHREERNAKAKDYYQRKKAEREAQAQATTGTD